MGRNGVGLGSSNISKGDVRVNNPSAGAYSFNFIVGKGFTAPVVSSVSFMAVNAFRGEIRVGGFRSIAEFRGVVACAFDAFRRHAAVIRVVVIALAIMALLGFEGGFVFFKLDWESKKVF